MLPSISSHLFPIYLCITISFSSKLLSLSLSFYPFQMFLFFVHYVLIYKNAYISHYFSVTFHLAEDFKNDDIAASLVSLIVDPIVKSSYGWATHHGIKQVFVTGSFACNNAYIQEEFARIFACKRFCNSEVSLLICSEVL